MVEMKVALSVDKMDAKMAALKVDLKAAMKAE